MRQTDLARHVGADAATMTRTIRRPEKAGFVRRVRSTRRQALRPGRTHRRQPGPAPTGRSPLGPP
ncbi:MarR family transcriptional regulator [Streptomyces olivaceoviridis]